MTFEDQEIRSRLADAARMAPAELQAEFSQLWQPQGTFVS